MPNIKAKLLMHRKEQDTNGHITEIKIWSVPVSEHAPHGVKYSFVYIVNGIRVIGYDNERARAIIATLGARNILTHSRHHGSFWKTLSPLSKTTERGKYEGNL